MSFGAFSAERASFCASVVGRARAGAVPTWIDHLLDPQSLISSLREARRRCRCRVVGDDWLYA